MRGIEIVLLAALFALVGVGAWNAHERLIHWGTGVCAGPAALPAKFRADVHTGNPNSDHPRRPRAPHQSSPTPAMAMTVDVPSSFPTPSSLRPGSTSAQIRATYGQPEARVTDLCGEHICERYYYYNKDHTQLTVATLENGVLVSSNSTSP